MRHLRNHRHLPLLAALTSVVLWASAFVGIRSAGHELSPGPLALARLFVAALALGLIARRRREPWPGRAGWGQTAACGVLWLAAYNVALNAAERRVDAGISSLLVNVAPIIIALIARRALRERGGRTVLVGCVISLAGVALIARGGSGHAAIPLPGVGLCLAAALAYAVGVINQKPALRHGSALMVTWLATCVGVVCCLPWAPQLIEELPRASTGALLWTIYLGLVPLAIGFTTWAYALSHTPAARLAPLTYLVPPIAVGLGWLLLGEAPPVVALPGGLLCLGGLALSQVRPRSARMIRPPGTRAPADASAGSEAVVRAPAV